MLKISVLFWIILTLLLLSFPLGFSLRFLFKKIIKLSKVLTQKMYEIKALDKMRNDILKKRVEESESENIWWDLEEKKEKKEKPRFDFDKPLQKSPVVPKIEVKQKKLLEKIHYDALLLKKDGKLDSYEKKLIEWLAISPENMEFNQLLADLYFTIGNHNKALSLLKKIIEIDPQNHVAIWQIGEIYLITWDFETAELLIEKAINIKPSNPKYYISLVDVLYNTNRKSEAINMMEKVVRLRPSNANYIYTLWSLYEEIEDLDNAKKHYFRVLEVEPSNEKAKKKLKNLA